VGRGAGDYPQEYCGICLFWGQNITQNAAVTKAQYDFWHNNYGLQDAFLDTAQSTMTYIQAEPHHRPSSRASSASTRTTSPRGHLRLGPDQPDLGAERAVAVLCEVPGPDGRGRLEAKPAFVEPNLFWNSNISFQKQEGGLLDAGTLGSRYVFNTHFYDQKAISGILMWGNAADGQYSTDFGTVRDRATAAGTGDRQRVRASAVRLRSPDKAPTVSRRCTRPSTPA
jgi:hypothetical protein